MKTGVNSYSFRRLVNDGQMKEIEVVSKAKELGFDVIEFSGLDVPQGETIESYAKSVKQECERAGIEVGNYTIPADFLFGSEGDMKAEVTRIMKHVEIAEILGASGLRHDATKGIRFGQTAISYFDDIFPILVKGCKAVTEYAAELGIKTMVENHGFFCQDSDRVERLVSGVNNANFGLLVDIGNFLMADEDPVKAVGKLMPYAFHVHVKDFHIKSGTYPYPGEGWFITRGNTYIRGAIVGHGDLPVLQLLKSVKKAGYDGTLSIEFEGLEEPIRGISLGLKNLKQYMAMI